MPKTPKPKWKVAYICESTGSVGIHIPSPPGWKGGEKNWQRCEITFSTTTGAADTHKISRVVLAHLNGELNESKLVERVNKLERLVRSIREDVANLNLDLEA